jgi:hypothetical protein
MHTTNVAAGGVLLLCSSVIAVGSGTVEPSLPVLVVALGAFVLSLVAVLVDVTSRSQSR